MIAVILVASVVFGYYLPVLIGKALSKYVAYKLKKKMLPQKADVKKICRGKHFWTEIKALGNDGVEMKKVCQTCGLIEGTDTVVTMETLDRLEEEQKLGKIEAGLIDEFFAKEDEIIKKLCKKELEAGIDLDLLLAVHAMGISFHERFSRYRLEQSKRVQAMLNKGQA